MSHLLTGGGIPSATCATLARSPRRGLDPVGRPRARPALPPGQRRDCCADRDEGVPVRTTAGRCGGFGAHERAGRGHRGQVGDAAVGGSRPRSVRRSPPGARSSVGCRSTAATKTESTTLRADARRTGAPRHRHAAHRRRMQAKVAGRAPRTGGPAVTSAPWLSFTPTSVPRALQSSAERGSGNWTRPQDNRAGRLSRPRPLAAFRTPCGPVSTEVRHGDGELARRWAGSRPTGAQEEERAGSDRRCRSAERA